MHIFRHGNMHIFHHLKSLPSSNKQPVSFSPLLSEFINRLATSPAGRCCHSVKMALPFQVIVFSKIPDIAPELECAMLK